LHTGASVRHRTPVPRRVCPDLSTREQRDIAVDPGDRSDVREVIQPRAPAIRPRRAWRGSPGPRVAAR
ncbi:MAG TPA: hypothetical protein VII33_20240, partial [Nakamurella sp.]